MKLISCYIENFGNIQKRDFRFDGGLNCFCEKNGYGKTTLAAFLRAMFYGLKKTTARDREMGARERFYPFGGGKFGGNVTFEKGGKIYKIERFFGRRSATEDSVALYENGTPLAGAEERTAEFFDIDENSFARTLFVTAADTEAGATGDISKLLNGFVDNTDGESAKKILDEKIKNLKKKGDGGKIAELKNRLSRLKDEEQNLKSIGESLGGKYDNRNRLDGEIKELEARLEKERKRELELSKWQHYDEIKKSAQNDEREHEDILKRYPKGLPDGAEAEAFAEDAEQIKVLETTLSATSFGGEKESELKGLANRFSVGIPTGEELDEADAKCEGVARLEAEISGLEGALEKLTPREFPAGVPTDAEIEKYKGYLAEKGEKSGGRAARPNKKLFAVLCSAAAVAACAGAGLFAVSAVAGAVLLVAGLALAVAGIFVYFKGQLNGLKTDANGRESEVASFLVKYGYYTGAGVGADLNNLARDVKDREICLGEREKTLADLAQKRSLLKERQGGVASLLSRYGFSGVNVRAEMTELRALSGQYVRLNGEKEEIEGRNKANRERLNALYARTAAFTDKYGLRRTENASADAGRIRGDVARAAYLEKRISEAEKRAENYRAENGLDVRPDGAEADAGAKEKLDKLRKELLETDRDIAGCERETEGLDGIREEIEKCESGKIELERELKLLTATKEFLEKAEGNLRERYISPVRQSFLKYGDALEKTLGERAEFDKDFKITFERGGEKRSDGHLSSGQKSLCALCIRLAFIDNMYRDEKPFIIMDDPFVHLDGEHIGRALELLKELSGDRQIIYFCCHESRKIK